MNSRFLVKCWYGINFRNVLARGIKLQKCFRSKQVKLNLSISFIYLQIHIIKGSNIIFPSLIILPPSAVQQSKVKPVYENGLNNPYEINHHTQDFTLDLLSGQ
jgi:hypothetical protein